MIVCESAATLPQVQAGQGEDENGCFEEPEGHCISYRIDFSRGRAWSKGSLTQDFRPEYFHSMMAQRMLVSEH